MQHFRPTHLPISLFAALLALLSPHQAVAEECLIAITNPPKIWHVPEETAAVSLAGTASATVTGQIDWVNAETAASGAVPVSTEWSIADISLALGTNTISVTGFGAELSPATTNAFDNGSDSTYSSAWNNGSNGGTGFGPWALSTDYNNPANGGRFMAEGQGNLSVGPRAWGLYANSGDSSRAARPFSTSLQIGQTFFARFDNNAVQIGGRVAVEMQNTDGEWLWYFEYVGGQSFYALSDQSTSIPFTDQGLEIAFTLASATTYSVTVTPLVGAPQTLTGNLRAISEQTLAQVMLLNENAGFDGTSNFYFNDIAILTENAPGPSSCSDTITVVRAPLPPVTVRINEFMASNGSTISDEDGAFEDWIELYNYGSEPVSLLGYGLTDNLSSPFKWVFPDVTLAPGEFRLVWASGKDRRPDDTELSEGILRQMYNDIPGILVSDLTSHPRFPDSPTSQGVITAAFEAPQNVGDNYGQRMHGYIRAPFTGDYRFYIASDDASELFVSTDTDPANAVLIASVPDWTHFQEWNKYNSQRSSLIPLVANQLYYISALMKEGTGGDHLSVGWSLGASFNRPISGSYLFTPEPGPLHTSWGISAAGEPLQLTDLFGRIVDFVDAIPVPRDISYGRSIADPDVWLFFDQPTPGSANTTPGFEEILPQPGVSTPAGVYTSPVSVTVTPGSDGAVVRYTLDGSEPTESSPILSTTLNFASRLGTPNGISLIPTNEQQVGAPFFEGWEPPAGEVFKIHTLRLRSFKSGAMPSRPLTQSYLIDAAGTNRYSLPIVSVTADTAHFFNHTTGIYVTGANNNYFQSGSAWERPGSVEFFEPDGTPGFNIEAGIRIHGGTTRNRPRKSLRIYARSPSTLSYSLFPDKPVTNFDTFILRNSGNDWGNSVFRDAFMQSLVTHATLDYQHARPAVVFVNGEYWGIHTIRDRFDDGYYEHHYGLDEDEFTQLETAYNGSTSETLYDRGNPDLLADYQDLVNFLDTQGVVSSANYAAVADRMDIDNYTEHYTAQIYFGNTDWPGNNMRKWRSVESNRNEGARFYLDGRWRWMLFDTDFGFSLDFFYVPGHGDFANHNTLAYAASPVQTGFSNHPNGTMVFRRLLQNADFQRAFVTRFSDQLNTAFATNRVVSQLADFESIYGAEMTEHAQRWRQPYNWGNDVNRMRSYAMQRTDAVWGHLQSFFGLGSRVSVSVNVNDSAFGSVRVNTMDLATQPGVGTPAFPWTGSYFPDYPVTVTARPVDGADFVAWVDAAQQVVSTDPSYTFMPAGAPALTAQFEAGTPLTLLHYWNFNETVNLLTPTLSIGGAAFEFDLLAPAVVTSGTGQEFSAENARFGDPAGAHLRVNDPTGAVMVVEMPTTGYEEILVQFETRRSGSGAGLQVIDYTTDGLSWQNFTTNPVFATPVLTTLDFTALPGFSDNPAASLRFTFLVGEGGEVGNNRFDNFTVEGRALPGVNAPPIVSHPVGMEEHIENASPFQVDLATVFTDPDNDPLSFSAVSEDPAAVSISLAGHLLTLTPLKRGDAVIVLEANDGVNPPTATSFRVLVYPKPAALADGDFTFTEWDANEPAGSFPEHMLFLQSDTSDPGLTYPLTFAYRVSFEEAAVQPDDMNFPYAAASRTRINGLGEGGISFINTGRGRDLGGALLALDTRGVTEAEVSWLGATLLANTRVYAIRLQYRVGFDGPFFDVLDADAQPVEYLRNATGHVTTFDPVALPAEAIGKAYVQLLWRYHYLSGESGSRAQLRLDEIAVGADVTPPELLSTYPSMFLRGTHNAWTTNTPMTLVADYTWEIEVAFGAGPDERFKFDAFGDWSVNWGDNEPRNGIGDPDGNNIPITQGEGVYRIVFNDDTKAYTVEQLDMTPVFLPGVTADWTEDLNWSTGIYPDAIGAAAIVNAPSPDADRNVNIRAPIVVGSMLVDNADRTARNRIRDRDTGNTLTFETAEPSALLHIEGDGIGFVEFEVEAGTILKSDLEVRVDNIEGHPDFGALRLRAPWSGPGGLTKTGPGMASLTGADKLYTGHTLVEQGVLAVSQPATLTAGAGVTVAPGGQLRLTSANDEGGARLYNFGGTLTLNSLGRTGVPADEGMGVLGAIRYEPGSPGNRAVVTSPVTLIGNAGLHASGLGNEMVFSGDFSGTHTLTKTGGGALLLTGSGAAFDGNIDVLNGALQIDGSFGGANIAVDAIGSLHGFGTAGNVLGSGIVAPGPGATILNVISVNGLSYAFQFTKTGAPIFGSESASGNDLLRLRGATPFVASLNAGNSLSIYLDVPALGGGDEFRGGFFTDNSADFIASVENSAWQIFLADPVGETEYEGQTYSPVSAALDWSLETVPATADFTDGTVEGRILRLAFSGGATGFPQWQANNFTPAELLDENISGPLADPDNTGVSNLERYGWGLDRNDPYEEALPRGAVVSDINGTEILYLYRRLIDPDSGLTYQVESSDDMLDNDAWRIALVGIDIVDEGTATPTGDGLTEEVAVPLEQSTIDPDRTMRTRILLQNS